MKIARLVPAALLASSFLAGCAPAYSQSYRQTNFEVTPKPVPADKVKVVKSANDLSTAWVELGTYKGKAPTVKEAMLYAKQTCGSKGATYYILNVEPFASESGWKIDGVCATKQAQSQTK